MVHCFKIVVFLSGSAVFLPALAAPVNTDFDQLITREPVRGRPAPPRRPRPPPPSANRSPVSNIVNRVGSVVSQVGSAAGTVGSIANNVGSFVSQFSGLFGREPDFEEEIFQRALLNSQLDAREPQPELEELDAREPEIHTRELEGEMEAREVFDDELD